jgi:hypothetical protein
MNNIELINIFYHKKYNLHLIKFSKNNSTYKIIVPSKKIPDLKNFLIKGKKWNRKISEWNKKVISIINLHVEKLYSNNWTSSNSSKFFKKLKENLKRSNIFIKFISNSIILKQSSNYYTLDLESGKISHKNKKIKKTKNYQESFSNESNSGFNMNDILNKIRQINDDIATDWKDNITETIKKLVSDPTKIKDLINSINDNPQNIFDIVFPSSTKELVLSDLIKQVGLKLKLVESLFNQYITEISVRTNNYTSISDDDKKLYNKLLEAIWETIKDILIEIDKFQTKFKQKHPEIKIISLQTIEESIESYQKQLSEFGMSTSPTIEELKEKHIKLALFLKSFNQKLDSIFNYLSEVYTILQENTKPDEVPEKSDTEVASDSDNSTSADSANNGEIDLSISISENQSNTDNSVVVGNLHELYSGPISKWKK